jgi:hypothetical protein
MLKACIHKQECNSKKTRKKSQAIFSSHLNNNENKKGKGTGGKGKGMVERVQGFKAALHGRTFKFYLV